MFILFILGAEFQIGSLTATVKFNGTVISTESISYPSKISTVLNENQTMEILVQTTFDKKPFHSVFLMENSVYHISSPFMFRKPNLQILLNPTTLSKLYKHSGKYSMSMMVADPSLNEPFAWDFGDVEFSANGEVVDNFTDTEWDFQKEGARPKVTITLAFTGLMILPLIVLVVLLFSNKCNCGYFPRSFDAFFTLVFIASLGALYYLFFVFWKRINFIDMLKYLCIVLPLMGISLRRALIGRAKMAARKPKTD